MDLLALPDTEFRTLVNKELRKDNPSLLDSEREELRPIAEALRTPEVVSRWLAVLETMKHSSETQLGSKLADVKKLHGTMPELQYLEHLRDYQRWKAGNMRFLHSLQGRILEVRELRTRLFLESYPHRLVEERNQAEEQLSRLLRQIEIHHQQQLMHYDPTEADEQLWQSIGTATAA